MPDRPALPHVWLRRRGSRADSGRSVVTIGVFDGVHRGHRVVVGAGRGAAARALGLPLVVVTFDPHPAEVVARARTRPGSDHGRPARRAAGRRRRRRASGCSRSPPSSSQLTAGGLRPDARRRACAPAAVVVGAELPVRAPGGRRRRARCRARASGTASRSSAVAAARPRRRPAVVLEHCVRRLRRRRRRRGRRRGAGPPAPGRGRRSCTATSAAASSASRPPTWTSTPHAAVPADGVYAGLAGPLRRRPSGCRPRSRWGRTRPSTARTRRVEAYVAGPRRPGPVRRAGRAWTSSRRLRGMERFDAVSRRWSTQMRRDVDARPGRLLAGRLTKIAGSARATTPLVG